jgi:signal transduction histidine kinase
VFRIVEPDTRTIAPGRWPGSSALGTPNIVDSSGNLINQQTINGYLVENVAYSRLVEVGGQTLAATFYVQYGRPLSQVQATVDRVRLLLFLGVLAGTGLALLAGLMIARRAMAPVARLTSTAREIADTRDPSLHVPEPEADDEVAELARTFDEMLRELDAARTETEATLFRQRQFVADASHELRTPLTSVLANLELLVDSLHGDQGEAASSALRSTQRMRRLVADLLLLARNDVGRAVSRQPVDLGEIAVEAAAELGPLVSDHTVELDIEPAVVIGVRDELYRVVLNLIENSLRHTPAGTTVKVRSGPVGPDEVEVVVEDDGPGVPPDIAPTVFERFVRGAGDRGGSTGLGLAIVRAVAESHGGHVALGHVVPHGASFVVRLPTHAGSQTPPDAPVPEIQAAGPA